MKIHHVYKTATAVERQTLVNRRNSLWVELVAATFAPFPPTTMPHQENAADASSGKRKALTREEEKAQGRIVKQRLAEVDTMEDPDQADAMLAALDMEDVLDPGVNISEAKSWRRVKEKQMKKNQISTMDGVFGGKELMQKIAQRYSKVGMGQDDDGLDWERLNVETAKFFAATPVPGFLSHSMCKDVAPKKARVVNQREKQPVVNQKPSYEYNEAEADKRNAMHRYRQMETAVLGLQEPVPVAKLVIDPDSFEESVYNYFALTALINDHKAAMDVTSYKAANDSVAADTIFVRPPNPELRKTHSENQDMSRRIDDLGVKSWREHIKRHKITKAGFKFNLESENTQDSQANTQLA